LSRFCELLHIKDGRLESTFWSGGMTGNWFLDLMTQFEL
jgi:hypothetical protein